jgi:YfiH family protein
MTPPFLRSDALPVRHGFFTRAGGVSEGPYASLNCSLSGQDDRAHVLENRARAARALGGAPESLVGLSQVHGVAVAVVEDPWAPGAGPRADAMVTRRPDLLLAIVTADCAPVLFVDPVAGVIGAAHAGWRGAVAGVLEATFSAMVALGASPARIAAAVGPCIGQESYEVGLDLREALLAYDPADAAFLVPGARQDHWQFDLAAYCESRLRRAGAASVGRIAADTAADPARFFSHRRRTLAGGGAIGHQVSIVASGQAA